PPAASIAARAPLVAAIPFRVTARPTSPDSMTFTRCTFWLMTLASFSGCRVTTSPSTLASSEVRTAARSMASRRTQPNSGCGRGHRSCPDRYRYHGRDDASRGVHPVRSAGHSVSWLTLHAQQIVGLVDHAAVFRSVLNLNGVTDATQAQALDACLVVGQTAV